MRSFRHMAEIMASTTAMLLMTAACVAVDVQECRQDEEMVLKPVATVTSKAPGTPVPFDYTTFGIYANYTSDAGETPATTAWGNSDYWKDKTPDHLFINDGCFALLNGSYAGADPSKSLAHKPYFWPSDGSLIFYAYAPHQSQSANITSVQMQNRSLPEQMGYITIDITLQPDEYKTFDLLWVDATDINLGKSISTKENPIPLVFRHAQSKITLKIKNPEEQYKVTATLLNCINSARFFSGDTPGWLPNFKNPAVDGTFVVMKDQNLTKDYTEASVFALPMLLDGNYQEVAAEQRKHVMLQLDIMEKDGVGKQTKTIDMTQYTKVWKPGINYIYTLTISNEKVVFGKPQIVNRDSIVDL